MLYYIIVIYIMQCYCYYHYYYYYYYPLGPTAHRCDLAVDLNIAKSPDLRSEVIAVYVTDGIGTPRPRPDSFSKLVSLI